MERVARAECDRLGLPLTVSREASEIQGTGGGIRGLKSFLSGDDCVVLNGDVLFSLDVRAAIEAHRRSGTAATMVLLPMPEGEKFNPVEVDAEAHVRRIAGFGPGGERLTSWHFSGAHVLSPRVFDFMRPQGPEDINRDVHQRMLEAGLAIHAHVVRDQKGYWSDLGTPKRYLATQVDALFGRVSWSAFDGASPLAECKEVAAGVWAHPSAVLNDARISGPAWFGAGAVLEPGVRIGAGVAIGIGARIGAETMLNRVAVLDGVTVESQMLAEDAIAGPDGIEPVDG
jgi:mannose-1-phosphate guanylyltransferase